MTIETLIERYEIGATLMPYAFGSLREDVIDERVGPGTWSLRALAIHLLDSDLVLGDRMKRVIAEEEPTLLPFDQDAWLTRLRYETLPIEEAAALFANHRRWFAHVLRGCSEADFARAGHHLENGRMTLAEILRGAVGHLDHHLRFLYAKRGNLGLAIYPRYSDVRE